MRDPKDGKSNSKGSKGNRVFLAESVRRGDFLTEYGSTKRSVLSKRESLALRFADRWKISLHRGISVLNGFPYWNDRVDMISPDQELIQKHAVASLINSADEQKSRNATFKYLPDHVSSLTGCSPVIVAVATADLDAGTEVLTFYGRAQLLKDHGVHEIGRAHV